MGPEAKFYQQIKRNFKEFSYLGLLIYWSVILLGTFAL